MMTGPNASGPASEREEIELLMPWYATGRLDAADRARVEHYLARHPEARRLIDLASEEAGANLASNEAIAPPAPRALEDLMAAIEADPKRRAAVAAGGLWRSCVDWVGSLKPSKLALAGVAAAMLILAQAATLATLIIQRPGGAGYEMASDPVRGTADKGTFALVSFAATANAASVTALLSDAGAEIIEGPKAGGVYRLRLSREILDPSAARVRLEKLQARTDVIAFIALTQ